MRGKTDSYQIYRKSSSNPVKIKIYREINDAFTEYLIDRLATGNIVTLPERMGDLVFVGRKVKPKIIDDKTLKGISVNWKATKDYWNENSEAKEKKQLIYHFNEHSCGIRYKFFWYRRGVLARNKWFYTFIPARALKRRFAKYIIEEQREFLINEKYGNVKVSIKD